jgi:hypothetical protein
VLNPRDSSLPEPISLPWLPRPLLVGGIIAIVGLVSLVVGLVAGRGSLMPLLGIILPALLIIAAMAAVRYFELLILLFPITALAMRFAVLPTGTASPLPISLVLTLGLIGIWLVTMFSRREWQVPTTPFNRSLFIFMAICCISLPWGILWRDPILNIQVMGRGFPLTQVASLISMLASMCVPFLVGYFIDSQWKIKFYLGAFIICGALMTITQIMSISQEFLNDAGLWGLWHVATLFGILITLPRIGLHWRALCALLIGANLYLTLVQNSGWLSGWLPTICAIMAIIFLRSRKTFFVFLTVAMLFVIIGPGRAYLETVAADEVEEGGLGRLEIWERNLGIVAQHWLLGTGPAGYAPYNMTYFPWDARSTHNNFFDILGQFGVVGLLVWTWFMFASLWFGLQTIWRAPPGLLQTTAIIATSGWAAALFSMMFGDWILPFAYNQGVGGFSYTVYSWIFLGLLVSVHRLLEASSSQDEAVTSHNGQTSSPAPTP